MHRLAGYELQLILCAFCLLLGALGVFSHYSTSALSRFAALNRNAFVLCRTFVFCGTLEFHRVNINETQFADTTWFWRNSS
jgi:hypothetical protein